MKYFIIYTHHPISIKGRKSLNIHLNENPSNKTIKHLLKLEMPYFKTTHWSLSWPFRKLLGLKVRVHYFNHDVCLQINFLTWGPFYYLLRRNFCCARCKKLFREFIYLFSRSKLFKFPKTGVTSIGLRILAPVRKRFALIEHLAQWLCRFRVRTYTRSRLPLSLFYCETISHELGWERFDSWKPVISCYKVLQLFCYIHYLHSFRDLLLRNSCVRNPVFRSIAAIASPNPHCFVLLIHFIDMGVFSDEIPGCGIQHVGLLHPLFYLHNQIMLLYVSVIVSYILAIMAGSYVKFSAISVSFMKLSMLRSWFL